MFTAEELLKPVSGENPCGEDLSYDPSFQELELLMRGKEETQFSAAEEPNWKLLAERCLELWGRSKDLRVATITCLASLKTTGLPGFRESLAALQGVLERHWDQVYPLLDPSDNNDPTQRVNVIAALATPVATFGDPMRLLERLQQAPLAVSVQMGRYGYADIVRSETGAAGPDGSPAPAPAQIEAAFKDTPAEQLQSISEALADSIARVGGIDQFLTTTIGASQAPDLEALTAQLKEMQKRLVPYLPAGAMPGEPEAGEAGAQAAGAAAPAKAISGEIQSRQDVVRMLDKICDYYRKQEPASPVPFVLRRARRLVEMDFMQIMGDLSPDSIKEIERITGEQRSEEESS